MSQFTVFLSLVNTLEMCFADGNRWRRLRNERGLFDPVSSFYITVNYNVITADLGNSPSLIKERLRADETYSTPITSSRSFGNIWGGFHRLNKASFFFFFL